jgi:hypothetical protein
VELHPVIASSVYADAMRKGKAVPCIACQFLRLDRALDPGSCPDSGRDRRPPALGFVSLAAGATRPGSRP